MKSRLRSFADTVSRTGTSIKAGRPVSCLIIGRAGTLHIGLLAAGIAPLAFGYSAAKKAI